MPAKCVFVRRCLSEWAPTLLPFCKQMFIQRCATKHRTYLASRRNIFWKSVGRKTLKIPCSITSLHFFGNESHCNSLGSVCISSPTLSTSKLYVAEKNTNSVSQSLKTELEFSFLFSVIHYLLSRTLSINWNCGK